jgi:hypothetical protein
MKLFHSKSHRIHPMKTSLLITILLWALAVPAASAFDLGAAMNELSGTDYDKRQAAREAVANQVRQASAPEADEQQRQDLRQALLQYILPEHPFEARDWAIRQVAYIGDAGAVAALGSQLNDADPKIRDLCRKSLSRIPAPEATAALLQGLGSAEEKQDVLGYLEAIATSAQAEAGVGALAKHSRSEEPEVANGAIQGLAKIPSPQSRDALLALVAGDGAQAETAAEALLAFDLTTEQAAALAENGGNRAIRAGAFRQLAALDPQAAQQLLGQARPPSRQDFLRLAAAHPQLGEAVRAQFEQLSVADQRAVLGSVKDYNLSAFEPHVIRLVGQAEDEDLKKEALLCAIQVASPASLGRLLEQHAGEAGQEEKLLERAIRAIEAPEYDQQLLQQLNSGDPQQQAEAIRKLGLRNPEGTLEVLHDIIQNAQAPEGLIAAFEVAERLGSMETARIVARRLLEIQDSKVRRAAQMSIKRIAAGLAVPGEVWEEVFQPILSRDDLSQDQKSAFIVILDSAQDWDTLEYLQEVAISGDDQLSALAIRNLPRWQNPIAAEGAVAISQAEGVSPRDKEFLWNLAMKTFGSEDHARDFWPLMGLGPKIFAAATNEEDKRAVLEYFAGQNKHRVQRAREALLKVAKTETDKEMINETLPAQDI